MTIAQAVAEWDRMARTPGFFYCNELDLRCSDPMCADCSTFAARGLNAGGADINPCANSFWLASWCYHAERPQWFIDRFGPGVGTFITYEQAQTVVCLGFRGNNHGMEPDDLGDGHVEELVGPGKRSVGAHSHATGVGYDDDGIDNHHLTSFAIPPSFLAEMAPPAWKVPPMFNPVLEVRAALARPPGAGGGVWIAEGNGTVHFIDAKGNQRVGGMISATDKAAFAGRTVAKLLPRRYGFMRRNAGYTIVATSGEKYVPSAQH